MPPLRRSRRARALLGAAAALLAVGLLGACSDSAANSGERLRVGYFPNVTHAAAIVGVEHGTFTENLGPEVELEVQTFNAGTAAVEAVMGGALDVAYLGPNPAIQAYVQSHGEAIRVIAGAAAGGAALVVSPEIESVEDLVGTQVASPQLGNTQDVALRHYLREQGFDTEISGRGDITIVSADNATILSQFREGAITAAWVPEPWVSRLVEEAGGKVLVDEASLWPDGRFVTTQVLVRTAYLDANPGVVESFLRGHVDALDLIEADPEQAKQDVNEAIEELVGTPLTRPVLDRAWAGFELTADPVASSLKVAAEHAVEVGVTEEAEIDGIFDLRLLNGILTDRDRAPVSAAGIGAE